MLAAGWLVDGFLHSRRQRVHALDVRGDRPQILVFRPNSIGEHAGTANPVFGCPENLRLRKVCADHRQFGDRWKQNGTTLAERLARSAVTSGTGIAIELSPCNQVRIGRRNQTGCTRELRVSELLACKTLPGESISFSSPFKE